MTPKQFAILEFIACEANERDYWLSRNFMSQRKRRPPARRLIYSAGYMKRCHGSHRSTLGQVVQS